MTDMNKISELRQQLEDLGCGVIIWVPMDFPGNEEARQSRFNENIDTVIDLCIERGNEAIGDLCGFEDDEEEE